MVPLLSIPNRAVKHASAYDTFGLSLTGQWVKAENFGTKFTKINLWKGKTLIFMSSTTKATSMADLMAKSKTESSVSLKKGEYIVGKITKLTPSEILIDIKGKTEAVVLENDKRILKSLLKNLKLNDEVKVTVINPESDNGYTVVSLRKFIDQKIWDKIEKLQSEKVKIPVDVKMEIKGGFLVETADGISGFLPNFNILPDARKKIFIGAKIELFIADINRADKKISFSSKLILGKEGFRNLVKNIKIGEKLKGKISNIATFGIFLNLEIVNEKEKVSVDGIVHISEISWNKVDDLSAMFEAGQEIEAVVIKIDEINKRIELSLKRLIKDPFEEKIKKYSVDQSIKGTVKDITDLGIVIDLGDENIEGIIRKEKIPVGKNYKKGDSLSLTISEIDVKRRKLYLAPVLLKKPLMYR